MTMLLMIAMMMEAIIIISDIDGMVLTAAAYLYDVTATPQ